MDAEHTGSPERPGSSQVPPADIEARLQVIVEDFLAALQAGERPDRAQVVDSNPELAPWLDERLKFVELVFQAAQEGDAADNGHLPGDRAKRLKCPHCGNQVQLVEPRPKEVTCLNCGSSFRVEPDTTATYQSSRPAREFGRFQVIELLGRGAFGEVYKARDSELDRFVALKVPRTDYFASSEEAQRFLREARSAAGLRHPSIVQVHEIAHERGTPYIVSDYIEGLTLADLISGGRPGFRESAELVAQLADALDYAHRQKVIHRDIKPSNILLAAPEGQHAGSQRFVPYLTDFGLARRDEGEITVTLDGQVLGTPAYMSPEQAAGDHARIDGRSDTYSLGVVLYELLSGELPFRGSRRMLLHQVLHDEPRPPRTLNDRIPRDLETICLKAMAKEPARRYATAADFRDDLRRFLRGDSITARRVGRTERTWRWCRRNPVIATLSSTAVLLLVAVATVSTVAYLRESNLVGEKDELIQEKSQLVTQEQAASARATKNETLATERAEQLERQSEELANQLYIAKLAKATAELDNSEYRAAEETLTTIPLKRRGWEYYQLWRRLEGTSLTLRGHTYAVTSVSFSPDGTRLASASLGDGIKLWDAQTGAELQTLRGHSLSKDLVSFSPDGTRLASTSWPNNVELWDAQTGANLQTLRGHTSIVTSVSFSADGTRLASACMGQIKLWDAQLGADLQTLEEPGAAVFSVSFSPDGTRLASASTSRVKLWDARSGAELQSLDDGSATSLRFSPDGTRLAGAGWDGNVKVWDAQSGAELQTLRGQSGRVNSVIFSPDGTRLASASDDQTVKLWDAHSGTDLQTLRGHSGPVNSLSFSPDGTRLASASNDRTVKLWDIQRGAEPRTINESHVNSVSFSTDGTRLASASYFETVKLWDTETGAELKALRGHSGSVTSVSFSPDGTRLASASEGQNDAPGEIVVWDAETGAQLKTLRGHTDKVASVIFSLDGTRLASASDDQTVKLWDARSGADLQTLRGHSGTVTSVSFSPDGTRLASASLDKTIKLWDAQTGAELQTIRGHTSIIESVIYSPDGTRLASASLDKTVKLWDARSGGNLQTLRGHTDFVHSVNFSPDGNRLASASSDKTVKLWDAHSGTDLLTLRGHPGSVRSVSFSADGNRLACASSDGIKLWDARTGAELQMLRGHTDEVASVIFSADAKLLASFSADRTIKLWDASTGAELQTLSGHSERVRSVAFSPDGKRLASASDDQTIKLWDVMTGAELDTLRGHTGRVNSVAFSPDGSRLASASFDETIKLWDAMTGAEVRTLRGHTGETSVAFSPDGTRLVSQHLTKRPVSQHDPTTLVWESKTLFWKLPEGELLPDAPVPDTLGSVLYSVPSAVVSSDRLLRAVPCGSDIQLIRKNPKYDPWKEDAERRKKLLPKWHADDAATAEQAENWYAAAFHLAWMMKLNPDDPVLPLRYAHFVKRLTAKGTPLPVICRGIPEAAIPEPTVSTMNLTYITRDGEMICYRFSDRSRQPVRCPTGTPRWIGWNSGEGYLIALVNEQLQRLPVDETSPPETLWTFEEVPDDLAVSADGKRLAWLRKHLEDGTHLMVQRFDGELPQDLRFGRDPDWSADGQRLTYVTRTDHWHIGVWDGKSTSFTTPPFHDSISAYPAFAPDGKHIAYGGCGPDNTRQIAVMTVDGEQFRLVTRNGRMNLKPAWSPDGRYLAYVRSGPDGDELAYVDLLTEEETVIAGDAAAVRPVWRKVDSP